MEEQKRKIEQQQYGAVNEQVPKEEWIKLKFRQGGNLIQKRNR